MRKTLVVALREYNAAVRTKTFVLGLVMMPILMGGSIALQWFFKEVCGKDASPHGLSSDIKIDRRMTCRTFRIMNGSAEHAAELGLSGFNETQASGMADTRTQVKHSMCSKTYHLRKSCKV